MTNMSLNDACNIVFGGVGAASPEIFSEMIQSVAQMCGRTVDAELKAEVLEIIKTMPCPLD